MAEITFAEALNQAIKEEMRRDESVYIMGESLRGGIYGVTGGLSQEFDERAGLVVVVLLPLQCVVADQGGEQRLRIVALQVRPVHEVALPHLRSPHQAAHGLERVLQFEQRALDRAGIPQRAVE